MNENSKILIVGHDDIIESSLASYFRDNGYEEAVSSSDIGLNPSIQSSVYEFFQKEKPEYVFLASTRSGGIEANEKNGAEFMYHNLESQNNILYASWKFGVKKLLYFAGSCIYPKECPQPMSEESLLTGALEKTSEPYSVSKIAGVTLCRAFRKQYGLNAVVMVPATIYGPGSDVDLKTAHVMGALIGKFSDAVEGEKEEVTVWGTGKPQREFLYVDDFIDASMHLMKHYDEERIVNVGCSEDVSIKDLAGVIAEVVGFKGSIVFDESKPDGAMRKFLDSSFMAGLGWKAKTSLKEGIEQTYNWYKEKQVKGVA